MKKVILALIITLFSSLSFAATYYVDGKNGWNGNTGSVDRPFKNTWKAWSVAKAGDTIILQPTITYGYIYLGRKSGELGKPITVKGGGSKLNKTKVSGFGKNYGIMVDRSNYVKIENFNVTAPGHGQYAGWSAIYVKDSHHVETWENDTHNSGCAGIQYHHSDYIIIKRNRVWNNAKDTHGRIFCSGISTHENLDVDSNKGVKVRIESNIVHHNTNIAPCSTCTNSDGSGIIIDDARRTQTDYDAYGGKHSIINNVVYANGGRGIHAYLSDNIDMFNNTIVYNNLDKDEGFWRPGEISVYKGRNIRIYSNILWSTASDGTRNTGKHVSVSIQETEGRVEVDRNVFFNKKWDKTLAYFIRNQKDVVMIGDENRFGDPLLVNPDIYSFNNDFNIKAGSIALGFNRVDGTFAKRDMLEKLREGPVTAGAYHSSK